MAFLFLKFSSLHITSVSSKSVFPVSVFGLRLSFWSLFLSWVVVLSSLSVGNSEHLGGFVSCELHHQVLPVWTIGWEVHGAHGLEGFLNDPSESAEELLPISIW